MQFVKKKNTSNYKCVDIEAMYRVVYICAPPLIANILIFFCMGQEKGTTLQQGGLPNILSLYS